MILPALLLVAQASPSPTMPEDIVVTGRRMERLTQLRITTKHDHAGGITRCVVKRHSGDPMLDTAVCDVVLACASEANTAEEMRGCVAPAVNALIAKGLP